MRTPVAFERDRDMAVELREPQVTQLRSTLREPVRVYERRRNEDRPPPTESDRVRSAHRVHSLPNLSRTLGLKPGQPIDVRPFPRRAALMHADAVIAHANGSAPALRQLKGSGMTAQRDAAYVGLLLGENAPGRGMAVIFSDGFDTSSWPGIEQVLGTARRADVLTGAVVLGGRPPEFLRTLTEAAGGTVFEAAAESALKATFFLRVLEDFKSRYVIGHQPAGVNVKGWHTLQVRVNGKQVSVKARPGYMSDSR